jgi:charged multivesicular body protein 7
LNPDGYAANIAAWQKGLTDALREGYVPGRDSTSELLVLRVNENLLRELETKDWGRPLALGAVVREGLAKKDMIPLELFLNAKESIYHTSWAIKPWQIVTWGLRHLGLVSGQYGEDSLPVGNLVVMSIVEEASEEVSRRLDAHVSRIDRIYSKKMFCNEFKNVLGAKQSLSSTDFDILLRYLARDKRLIMFDGQTIKVKGFSETAAPNITAEDTTIASLKTLIVDIGSQIDTLNSRIELLSVTAREAVSKKNRVSALVSLRTKKLVESNLSKQSTVLGQLEEVLAKISQAADQVELVRIMEGSTGVLKTLHAELGGVERVDAVVDQLKEQISQVDEVANVIAEAGQNGVIDEGDVDDELEEMEREEREEREKKEETERLAREERERQEAAETKTKLDSRGSAEHEPLQQRNEEIKLSTASIGQHDDAAVEEGVRVMERMSL